MSTLATERDYMDSRVIRVSRKRQITIPLKFHEALNLGDQVECSLEDGAIIIRPLRRTDDEFSVEILKALVSRDFPVMNWLGNSKQSGTESRKQSTGYERKRTESLMVYSRPLALMIFSTQRTDNV